MANENLSFNDFVQAERQKKKNENLWNEIRGRKNSNAPGAGLASRKSQPSTPSLASRMGVTKRSSSAKPNINEKWGHDLHPLNNPRGGRATPIQRTASASRVEQRRNRLYSELNIDQSPSTNTQPSLRGGARNTTSGGINIRGMGQQGPYTVVASNFAPGTTAADIEAVMAPIGGEMVNCRLAASHPTVMAEMQFVDKDGADNVIATFNNKKADGRLLYVYLKNPVNPPTAPRFAKLHTRPEAPAPRTTQDRDVNMDVDAEDTPQASVSYQDGRFGFNDSTNEWRRDSRRGRARGGRFRS